jgi:hypothetical protein
MGGYPYPSHMAGAKAFWLISQEGLRDLFKRGCGSHPGAGTDGSAASGFRSHRMDSTSFLQTTFTLLIVP